MAFSNVLAALEEYTVKKEKEKRAIMNYRGDEGCWLFGDWLKISKCLHVQHTPHIVEAPM
jgi:hypothetical protein